MGWWIWLGSWPTGLGLDTVVVGLLCQVDSVMVVFQDPYFLPDAFTESRHCQSHATSSSCPRSQIRDGRGFKWVGPNLAPPSHPSCS